jgi:hypothetical protein
VQRGGGAVSVKAVIFLQCSKARLLDDVCFVCNRPFSEKKLSCLGLDESTGKLSCLMHFVHDFCGPCSCRMSVPRNFVSSTPKFGFDIGGVIVPGATGGDEDTLLGNNVGGVMQAPGSFECPAKLVGRFGLFSVHIVSKAGDRGEPSQKRVMFFHSSQLLLILLIVVEENTLRWMKIVSFVEKTGVPLENMHFVRERGDKSPLCDKLGINVFVYEIVFEESNCIS